MKSNLNERFFMRGTFTMNVFRKGKLIEHYEDHNLIVNGARNAAAHLLAGDIAGHVINRIAFGEEGTEPVETDTEITEPFIRPVDGFTYPENGHLEISWQLPEDAANGKQIIEFGLLCEDDTLFARKVRNTPIGKEADISIEGTWTIIF